MKRFFLVMGLSILFSASALSDTVWTKIDETSYTDFDNIVGLEDIYGYSFLLKTYNKGQFEPINGRNILYAISQYEIDCRKNSYKIGTIDSYDEDDAFVYGDYNRFSEFQPIVEGSSVSIISKKLCRS